MILGSTIDFTSYDHSLKTMNSDMKSKIFALRGGTTSHYPHATDENGGYMFILWSSNGLTKKGNNWKVSHGKEDKEL
jgi:hypothetical protein